MTERNPSSSAGGALPVTEHQYTDEEGNNLYRICRIGTGKDKVVWQEPWGSRPAATGQFGSWEQHEDWLRGESMNGVRLVLYRLPAVRAAASVGMHVYVTEGEKCAERVEQEGEVATTNPGGAGKWGDSYSESMKGVGAVTICVDTDEEGWNHARQVLASLRRVLPATVRIATVEAKEGHDVKDHLDAGLSLDELVPVELGDGAPPRSGSYEPLSKEDRLARAEAIKKSVVQSIEETRSDGMPRLLFFKDVESKPIRWFWRPYLPWSKIIIIDGEGEMGKSSIVTDLGATGTVGGRLPDGSSAPESGVLLLGAEDDIEDTMKPRFEAAGAEMSRVASLILPKDEKGNTKPLTIPDQIGWLRHSIVQLQEATGLSNVVVVVDPISSYLSINVQSHNDSSVRTAMLPLHELMVETGALCILIRHFTKDEKQSAKNRGGGSVGFINAARSALVVGRHPHKPDLSVLARNKNNLASKEETPSWGYRLAKHPVLDVVRVVWEGIQSVDADEIVATPDARKNAPQKERAMKIIAAMLEESAENRIHAAAAMKACRDAGISRATVYSAKKAMGVMEEQIFKEDGGYERWEWFRPSGDEGTGIPFDPKS